MLRVSGAQGRSKADAGPSESVRHFNIKLRFVAAMPVLLPQFLQPHDFYVRVDEAHVDRLAVSGDTEAMHTGEFAAVAVE